MNNLSSYYGLTDSRMSASDTDLPVSNTYVAIFTFPEAGGRAGPLGNRDGTGSKMF